MIGLVVVTHASLAHELLKAAEMIVGKLELAEAVGLQPEEPVDRIRDSITGAIDKVSAEGVIIMTDMFGGTPSNMSLSFLQESRVEVITGVNLPMIVQFASDRSKKSVPELADRLQKTGRESISVAGAYLKK